MGSPRSAEDIDRHFLQRVAQRVVELKLEEEYASAEGALALLGHTFTACWQNLYFTFTRRRERQPLRAEERDLIGKFVWSIQWTRVDGSHAMLRGRDAGQRLRSLEKQVFGKETSPLSALGLSYYGCSHEGARLVYAFLMRKGAVR